MNDIICAIEQEIKHTRDSSGQGSSQYRAGYQQALGIVAEFLAIRPISRSLRSTTTHTAVKRLLSFVPKRSIPKPLDEHLDETLTDLEKRLLRITLDVLRSGQDHADYLHWWLDTYGFSTESHFAAWQPSTEKELDQLEKELTQRFGSVFS